jgi:hypothetical protein
MLEPVHRSTRIRVLRIFCNKELWLPVAARGHESGLDLLIIMLPDASPPFCNIFDQKRHQLFPPTHLS